MSRTYDNIPEAKIRNAIWYLKNNKTKKFVCDFLGIPYNVKKLDSLITDFRKGVAKELELRQAARHKVFTEVEKQTIVKQYLAGDSQAKLAEDFFVSTKRIKDILLETNTPIRGKGKKTTKVDHIEQDLETKLDVASKAFFTKNNCFVEIVKVYDEEYIDYLQDGYQKYIETYPFNYKTSKYSSPVEGIHYEIYWYLQDGSFMKLSALQQLISSIIKNLEQTGREYYKVWRIDEENCFYYAKRDELYPIREH